MLDHMIRRYGASGLILPRAPEHGLLTVNASAAEVALMAPPTLSGQGLAPPLASLAGNDQLIQTLTFLGTPLFAFVLSSIVFPDSVPHGTSMHVVNGVGVVMVAGRTRTTLSQWGSYALTGEPEAATRIKQAATLLTLLGALMRTVVVACSSGRHFWRCNRALAAFNGLLLALTSATLASLDAPPVAFLPGTVSFGSSMTIALGMLLQAALFHPRARWAISAHLSALLARPRKVSVASPPSI